MRGLGLAVCVVCVVGVCVVRLAEVVRVVTLVQRLLLFVLPDVLDEVVEGSVDEIFQLLLRVLPDVLDEYFDRAVYQIVQHWTDEQARFQCHRRFNRMDDVKWCARRWCSGCRSALERHAACLYDEGYRRGGQ